MSDRDRQNAYERDQHYGSGGRREDYGSSHQANQWQDDGSRQQGGYWQHDADQRGSDSDYRHDFRSSGREREGRDQGYDRDWGSSQEWNRDRASGSWSRDEDLRGGRSQAGRGYQRDYSDEGRRQFRGQGGIGQAVPRQGSSMSGYRGGDYDASGGNDFGNFTSEDFGGRDFYNRGGASGGMRSSESYRPSYGISSWFNDDDDTGRSSRGDRGRQSRDEYGEWRKHGESRGFFDRAGDEIASWFGDKDAARRREQDERENHRGRGPASYTRSDERIREDANDHLTHDWGVDASEVTVSVKDGELTLDGTVDSRQAKRRAEDCVENISGVKHVQNNLRVRERSARAGASGSASYGSSEATYGSGSSLGGHSSGFGGSASDSGASATSISQSGATGQTGANTTSGVGSAALAGVGNASTKSANEKTD